MHDADNVISTLGTTMPRYVAAFLDQFIAFIVGVTSAKAVTDDLPAAQAATLVVSYVGYYFLLEGMFARTPGKLLAGSRLRVSTATNVVGGKRRFGMSCGFLR